MCENHYEIQIDWDLISSEIAYIALVEYNNISTEILKTS